MRVPEQAVGRIIGRNNILSLEHRVRTKLKRMNMKVRRVCMRLLLFSNDERWFEKQKNPFQSQPGVIYDWPCLMCNWKFHIPGYDAIVGRTTNKSYCRTWNGDIISDPMHWKCYLFRTEEEEEDYERGGVIFTSEQYLLRKLDKRKAMFIVPKEICKRNIYRTVLVT